MSDTSEKKKLSAWDLYELIRKGDKALEAGEAIWYKKPEQYVAQQLAEAGFTSEQRTLIIGVVTEEHRKRMEDEKRRLREFIDMALRYQRQHPEG